MAVAATGTVGVATVTSNTFLLPVENVTLAISLRYHSITPAALPLAKISYFTSLL